MDQNEHIKNVYAKFGLAIYFAQVLEHGLVNALLILDLIPARHHLARSRAEWERDIDSFTNRHFETTMGTMMRNLRSITNIDSKLESLLRDALRKRNWLAHNFSAKGQWEFLSDEGREQMLREVDECRGLFERADAALEAAVEPVRIKAGITDEYWRKSFNV
jgi:hypothetical protein